MTVKQVYEADIDLDIVVERAECSHYWYQVYNFIDEVWNTDVENLTQKQIKWLDNIMESM